MGTKYSLSTMILGVALLGAVGVGSASGQDVSYSGSVQFATGSYYFTERTGSFYFSNGFGISGERLSLYANIPLMVQNTPWVSYSGSGVGLLPTGGPKHGLVDTTGSSMGNRRGNRRIDLGSSDTLSFTEMHFGDPSVNAYWRLYESGYGRTSVSGTFGMKFPMTDSDSGFGTGGWDFGAGLSLAQRFQTGWLIFASSSYWWLGDMDELDFNNILAYGASLGRSYQNGKLMAVANFFGSTRVINDVDPPVSTGVGISFQATSRFNINGNTQFGLTESASDFSIGFGWSLKF